MSVLRKSRAQQDCRDMYDLGCSFCEIQIEISQAAYATRCADVGGVLGGVRKGMEQSASRPRIDRTAMQKPAPINFPRCANRFRVTT
jgi:hypothetical protein